MKPVAIVVAFFRLSIPKDISVNMINTTKPRDISCFGISNGAAYVAVRSMLIGTLLCLGVTGCGDSKKSDSPAAVIVNGEPLVAAELNYKLSQYDHFPADRKAVLTEKLLQSMVETELLRQAAIQEKLDVDEVVRAKIASANRLILAEAYLTKKGAAIPRPDESEIKAYFDQHPELYADRRVYELRELVVPLIQVSAAEIRDKLGDGKKYDEFVAWLSQKKISSNSQPVSAAAEDMREDILGKLKNAKEGDVVTLEQQNQLSIIHVVALHSQPMPLEQAKPIIEERLYKQRRTEAMDSMFTQLREKAKIEYVAPYSESGIVAFEPK